MKKSLIISLSFLFLISPIIVIFVLYLKNGTKFFTNPNFWYAYMAYFGTVALAAVSLWQNENANETNKRQFQQQLQQKIGYLELTENIEEIRKLYKYQELKLIKNLKESKNEDTNTSFCCVSLKNVGEDIILNPKIKKAKINGENVSVCCSLGVIFIEESINFKFQIIQDTEISTLNLEFEIQMQNVAGINYSQKFFIQAKQKGYSQNEDKKTIIFEILSFNTDIYFQNKKG